MEELYAFIANNIEYPEAAKRLNISGKVKVEFIVDKDGTVKNPVVVNGIGGGCDEEALRIVKKMPSGYLGNRMVFLCLLKLLYLFILILKTNL
jgi:TonB family protein